MRTKAFELINMNNNPIDLPLRDIHLPDPISWWPLAIGWWLALGAILLAIILTYFIVKWYTKPKLKKHALLALQEIETSYQKTENASHCIAELSILLRRAVLSQKHSKDAPSLTGPAWLELLDQPLKKPEFSQGIGKILLTGPYQQHIDNADVVKLIQLCRKWVHCL